MWPRSEAKVDADRPMSSRTLRPFVERLLAKPVTALAGLRQLGLNTCT
jgi:hypothetical protein